MYDIKQLSHYMRRKQLNKLTLDQPNTAMNLQ